MTNFKKVIEAVRLRTGNVPLSQIAALLCVGKSTVSDWLRKAESLNLDYELIRKIPRNPNGGFTEPNTCFFRA